MTAPISTRKTLGLLVPIYLLITLPAVWKIRQICLIDRDECSFRDMVDTVVSSKLLVVGCVVLAAVLVHLTFHVISRARNNTLGVEDDSDDRRFDVNGYLVAIIVIVLYTGGSAALLMAAAKNLEPFDIEKVDAYFWKAFWVSQGVLVIGLILFHLNDYLVRPVSRLFLAVLFLASLGSLYWVVQLEI